MSEPGLLGQLGRAQGALHHGMHGDRARIQRLGQPRVGIHQLGEELLVEAPPVHADPHGLAVVDGDLDYRAEVLVVVLAAHIARVDPVLAERPRAVGELGEEHVAVVVEIADHRGVHLLDDLGHGPGRGLRVHRHTHQLAARGMEGAHLGDGGVHIRRVGVGHGLDDDGARAADLHPTHVHQDRLPALGPAHAVVRSSGRLVIRVRRQIYHPGAR